MAARVLLFDWDNTLVDSWELLLESMNAALRGLGREPWTLEHAQFNIGDSLREAFPRLFAEQAEAARRLYRRHFLRHHLSRLNALPEVEGLLQTFSAQLPLGVLSNKTGTILRQEVAQLGWRGYFRAVVGAEDARADKPDKAILLHAFEQLGMAVTTDFVYVGDAPIDMRMAQIGGGIGVLFNKEPPSARFAAAPPHHYCPSVASLRATLKTLLLRD